MQQSLLRLKRDEGNLASSVRCHEAAFEQKVTAFVARDISKSLIEMYE